MNTLDQKVLQAIFKEYSLDYSSLLEMSETFVIDQLYDMLFYRITTLLETEDTRLDESNKAASDLDLCQMGIDWKYGFDLVNAIEVYQINS